MGKDDRKRVQERAEARQRERGARVESIIRDVQADLGELDYPVSSEELAARYADQTVDLPNETESLGSAFDRIDETFADSQTAVSALLSELDIDLGGETRQTPVDPRPTDERNEPGEMSAYDEPVNSAGVDGDERR